MLIRCHTMTEARQHHVPLGSWPEVVRPMGCTDSVTFTFTGSCGFDRVTEVQCQFPHQCHQGLIDLWGSRHMQHVANTVGSQEAI